MVDPSHYEDLANEVAEHFDARVYVYSGAIDRPGYIKLVKAMQVDDKVVKYRPNSLLILTTHGAMQMLHFK